MRKDSMCLHISLGFSTLIACPAFFMITSSAFSPKCLYSGEDYVKIQTLKQPMSSKGNTNTNLVDEDMTIECKSVLKYTTTDIG